MTSLTGNSPEGMRSPWSFMGSIGLHAWVLGWVALIPAVPVEPYKNLYEREIQPYEKHIVWYKLSDRLPDVKPPEAPRDPRPLRARAKFEQNIVAGPKDTNRPPQLIFAPAPEIAPAKPLPLPNIVAVAPERPPALPFRAPPVKAPTPERTPSLPDAPKVALAAPDAKPLDLPVQRIVRPFTPPKNPKLTLPSAAPVLPVAPEVALAAPSLDAPVSLPHQQPKFVAPVQPAATPGDGPVTLAAPSPSFTANAAMSAENSLAIAGLNPAKSDEVPAPPGSVKSGFSGGPKPQPNGGNGTSSGAVLEIPSLTVQGGAKNAPAPVMMTRISSPTSPENLAAAMRAGRGAATPGGAPPTRGAVRVSDVPDPRMYGRQVYTMAIQIPNLTSYSGSWMVWFASREADRSDASVELKPPLPLHMVSARYIHSAEEERIEGKVRLWAVIGKDGHIGDISLLQHLDDRLDQSAEEALGKWQFQPAQRNGVTIDVDAVFEVPFTLAPKPVR
jgi:TonB family protein